MRNTLKNNTDDPILKIITNSVLYIQSLVVRFQVECQVERKPSIADTELYIYYIKLLYKVCNTKCSQAFYLYVYLRSNAEFYRTS